jgi:hypothetical protein
MRRATWGNRYLDFEFWTLVVYWIRLEDGDLTDIFEGGEGGCYAVFPSDLENFGW